MTSPIYTALFDAIDAAMDDVADMDTTRQDYARAATEAAMKACGPRELVWKHPTGGDHRRGECFHARTDLNHHAVHHMHNGWWYNVTCKTFPTLEAAKAAAQSHADAAHWANTVIGAGVGNG